MGSDLPFYNSVIPFLIFFPYKVFVNPVGIGNGPISWED